MPRATEVTSESETERVHTGSTKKTYASKKRRATSASESDVEEVEKEVNEEPEDTAAEGDEDGEDEGEFEIEKILDAKKGQFHGGRMGYFVKWKGYEEEHNSWVDEHDAENARELIDQFWADKKKSKTGPRKSEPVKTKPKLAEKPPRKSLADIESSVEPEVGAKKRGRPKKEDTQRTEARDEDEDEQRAKKKPRKSNGLAPKEESDREEPIGNMKKHMKVPSWEDLIETIDTVEREDDGELYVFFTLKDDKKRVRESSRICAEKFPQKLIMFYESNLRWKTEDEPADAD